MQGLKLLPGFADGRMRRVLSVVQVACHMNAVADQVGFADGDMLQEEGVLFLQRREQGLLLRLPWELPWVERLEWDEPYRVQIRFHLTTPLFNRSFFDLHTPRAARMPAALL